GDRRFERDEEREHLLDRVFVRPPRSGDRALDLLRCVLGDFKARAGSTEKRDTTRLRHSHRGLDVLVEVETLDGEDEGPMAADQLVERLGDREQPFRRGRARAYIDDPALEQ